MVNTFDKIKNEEMNSDCKKCKKRICTDCQKENDHDVGSVSDTNKTLATYHETLLKSLTFEYDRKRKQVNRQFLEVRTRNEVLHSKNVTSLKARRETLHRLVDELIDEDLITCHSQNSQLTEELNKAKRKHKEESEAVHEMLASFRKTPVSELNSKCFDDLKSRVQILKLDEYMYKYCDRMLYSEANEDRCMLGLQHIIGQVEEGECQDSVLKVSSFRYKDSPVYTICPVSRNKAWITHKGNQEFMLINLDGTVEDSIPKQTDNFFVTDDDDFITPNYRKEVVFKTDRNSKTTTVIKTSPLRPFHVGKALHGNILVTLVDSLSYSKTQNSRRLVQMISPRAEVIHTYEFGEDGTTPVLTIPSSPTQNFNTNVCVVNEYEVEPNTYRGNLCVFYEDGGLKFVYNGKSDKYGFLPQDICCDNLCNIICVNYFDDSVHVINSEGTLLTNLVLRIGFCRPNRGCLPKPSAIALYKDMLWEGSHTGDVIVYRYLNRYRSIFGR